MGNTLALVSIQQQILQCRVHESIAHITGRKLDFIIIGVLALALVFVVIDNYVLNDEPEVVVVETIQPTVEVTEQSIEPPSSIVEEPEKERRPNSVDVLHLENISPNPEDAYFATGIHEEILNQLAKLRNLNVIARTRTPTAWQSRTSPALVAGFCCAPHMAE